MPGANILGISSLDMVRRILRRANGSTDAHFAAAECGREAAKRSVAILFDNMDVAAEDAISITPPLIGGAHAEIAQKV